MKILPERAKNGVFAFKKWLKMEQERVLIEMYQ